MKNLTLVLLALVLCATHAAAMEPDKQLHFGMSVPFGVLGAHLVYEYHPALTRQHPAVKILGGALVGSLLYAGGRKVYLSLSPQRVSVGMQW